ncbi:MAG TPA: sigma-70 family RNA polymerase sigma factor [Streptosporangiaceae bacterium]|jgi:RNA polymerase sigma-70 factor (ECF subfamily)
MTEAGTPDLAAAFEGRRGRLRAIAYRMLGSLSDADDAVEETWLRLSRSGADDLANLDGWLTTVTSRICLDMLRSRSARHEEPLGEHLPDPVVSSLDAADPEQEAELADAVSMALLVVLDKLSPTERLAFVLHDMFSVPFDDIAVIVGRSPNTAAQLASRARRRVRGSAAGTDTSLARQQQVVGAWLAAARRGDFDALLRLLDPDVVVRIDLGALAAGGLREVRGAAQAVGLAASFRRSAPFARAAMVSGAAGIIVTPDSRQPPSVMAFTYAAGKITEIYILADRSRLASLGLGNSEES